METMMGGEQRDLLSELPDGILGHILSFLPSDEAGRAAVLSRRWRDVFASVHTISFEQPEGERELTQLDDDEFYEAHDMTSPNADFVHGVAAALLSRRRSAGRVDVPLRRLHVSMFRYADWDSVMIDNCLNYALRSAAGDEFHLDLRLCGVSTCRRDNGHGYYGTQEEDDDSSCDEVDDIDGTDIVAGNGNGHTENYNVVHGGWGSGVEDGIDGTNVVVGDNANEYNDDSYDEDDDDSDDTDMVGGDGNEHMENDNIVHGGWGWGAEEGIDGMNMVGGNANEDSENGSDGPDGLGLGWGIYHVPRIVFRFVALRTLCLQMFSFDDDAHIDLPFVETLYLSKTFEPWTGIQRLISGCPRLTDLTLEECWTIKEVSITDVKLSRFALRCCHSVLRVMVDASEMKVFEYRGMVPEADSQLSLVGLHRIISCHIDFCGKEPCRKEELLGLRKFLMAFVGSQHLHLSSARLGCHIESNSFSGFPNFYNLRHLELKGCLLDDLIVDAVTKVLEQTPNLEALTLFISPKIISGDSHELEYDTNLVPNIPNVSAACLQYRLRQINLVHYQGSIAQRIVAKWLLQNAVVLNKLCVVFPKGPLWLQEMLIRETRGWSMNQSVNMLFI